MLIRYIKQKDYPINSLTLDNDPAFVRYKEIGKKLKAKVYFCDPYKSYQKGAIENGNRLFRETLSKHYKIDGLDQMEIDQIADKLNNRPLKALNFMTPKEAFLGECETYGVVPDFAVRA